MKPVIKNEMGILRKAIVCSPENFFLTKPINETQKYYYKTRPPQKEKLIADHNTFLTILSNNHVDLMFIPPSPDCPYQTFARDTGFVIIDRFFISRPHKNVRKKEILVLMDFLGVHGIKYIKLNKGYIEGGDVIVHGNQIFIGISGRTNSEGLQELGKQLPATVRLIPIRLTEGILHLDTVFTVLNDQLAFVFEEGIAEQDLKVLEKNFDLIKIEQNEFFELAINILFLSPQLAIIQRQHQRINKILNEHGIRSIEINYYNMIKLGGSFRCNCLPLFRENGLS
jgi:N-dimethylarginine dimethylaminohydrolase